MPGLPGPRQRRARGRAEGVGVPRSGGIDDRRFEREGHLLQALHHPNIVGIVGQGVDAKTGRAYLALELVPGRDLLSILSDCPEGKLSLEEACFVIEKVARALSAVHELEIVHRDIKPGNVLVTPEGQVKVTDFGIALMQGATRLTNPQEIVGTAQHMAPEAIEDGDYTPAVDIYALGSLAFRLLTGRDLFHATACCRSLGLTSSSRRPGWSTTPPSCPSRSAPWSRGC